VDELIHSRSDMSTLTTVSGEESLDVLYLYAICKSEQEEQFMSLEDIVFVQALFVLNSGSLTIASTR
jgi:hypothetical protein